MTSIGTSDNYHLPERRIMQVAEDLNIDPERIWLHGHYIAKIHIDELVSRQDKPDGQLILVTAMTPTPQGEGKTTTTIGLADGLRHIGKKSMICIREPSLGPYFGVKGGGTGAGKAQVVPAEDINLHFVGDMYAVEKANNLLAAMTDNHLQHGNELNIDPRRIVLKRVIDLNDRALRQIIIGLGGSQHGVPRQDGFNINPASEVMAILCLAKDFFDLGDRLSKIIVGFTYKGEPIRADQLQAVGAMQVILRDAIHPNLVQSIEGTPAFVHGGPFANIAHGANSAIATRMALKLADYVVTEAGFATDLGAEKFFHIKCRTTGLKPSAVVVVATLKAIEFHGGKKSDGGYGNLLKHIENIRAFGIEPVVAINRFTDDNQGELNALVKFCEKNDTTAVVAEHYEKGGKGATELADAVLQAIQKNKRRKFKFLYDLNLPIEKKIENVAKAIYGADGVDYEKSVKNDIKLIEKLGFANLPVCIAKTPLSLSDEPSLKGRPSGFKIKVNELRISAGAGFIVAICGTIVTMPGLPKIPAAAKIKILPNGRATGLS